MKTYFAYIKRWVPSFLWAGLIFYLSSQSSLPSAQKALNDFIFKKAAHMSVYGVLYWLVVRGFSQRTRKTYILAFVITIAYAISDEIHQSFTPGRHPKFIDVGFDTWGATVAFLRLNNFI